MRKSNYRYRKIKFKKKDSQDRLYSDLKKKLDIYFSVNCFSRYGNLSLFIRALLLFAVCVTSYVFILISVSFYQILISYLFLGFTMLIIVISLGHDAAHNSLTGKAKLDNIIFEAIFGLLGINGYLWKIKHNHSHHPFPNVYGYDSDLEFTNAFFLNPNQKKKKVHYYQHMYAPFLYMCATLIWIFYTDLIMFKKKEHANLISFQHKKWGLIKFITIKVTSISFFLILPIIFSTLPTYTILLSYIFMHLLFSIFIMFTFFISHHVSETNYCIPVDNSVSSSWVEQQVAATMDFHAESKIANFFFGGFNAHLAHHLFPEVCHIHYPALTRLIKQTLSKYNIHYNSLSYVHAIHSHLKLLKEFPRKTDMKK